MKILLDTCSFLWLVADSVELSTRARQVFEDPANDVYLSVASAWEIIVKHKIGKLPLPEPPQNFIKNNRISHQIETLSLDESAVLQLSRLPEHHKDPFDRIIICQAIAGGMTILTPDTHISRYPVKVYW